MASGDTLLIINALTAIQPDASTAASLTTIVGTSTPPETFPVIAFDDTTQEYMDFFLVMPQHYAGTTGVTVRLFWSAVEPATDVVEWQAAFREIADDAEDIDTTAHTYDFNAVVATAPSVVGEVAYDSITFTDGADMDSVGAGDVFVLRVSRDPSPSSGTDVTGDAYLHGIEIQET